jgi:uncharacterized protein
MLYALWCTDKPDHLQVRMANRPFHLEYLNKLNADGVLKVAGPLLDDNGKPCGSMLIYKVESLEEAKAIAAADPYTIAGLFETVEIKPFDWVFNNPEA